MLTDVLTSQAMKVGFRTHMATERHRRAPSRAIGGWWGSIATFLMGCCLRVTLGAKTDEFLCRTAPQSYVNCQASIQVPSRTSQHTKTQFEELREVNRAAIANMPYDSTPNGQKCSILCAYRAQEEFVKEQPNQRSIR